MTVSIVWSPVNLFDVVFLCCRHHPWRYQAFLSLALSLHRLISANIQPQTLYQYGHRLVGPIWERPNRQDGGRRRRRKWHSENLQKRMIHPKPLSQELLSNSSYWALRLQWFSEVEQIGNAQISKANFFSLLKCNWRQGRQDRLFL